ncbi:MAG: 30S ribosomal protein S2 [Terriglobales bacterium]
MASISMKELLEAGVHFGHQTRRWNPKMKEFIFGERNGIYIVDLQKTLKMFKDASRFVQEQCAKGKTVLFVGTKRQAQDAIAEESARAGMYHVNQRWLGGLLTNWVTIQKSIKRLKELDEMAGDGRYEQLPKKEVIKLERERKHLHTNLAGIKDMPGLPDVIFVIDSNKEQIAVAEARKLGIPVVAVVDTNCDPTAVDHVIPGNDDALRAIRLFTSRIADACVEGRQLMASGGEAAPPAGEGGTEAAGEEEGGADSLQSSLTTLDSTARDADLDPRTPAWQEPELRPELRKEPGQDSGEADSPSEEARPAI